MTSLPGRVLTFGPKNELEQVTRELNVEKLPESSRNWINEKLIYTHGYGVTMPLDHIHQVRSGEAIAHGTGVAGARTVWFASGPASTSRCRSRSGSTA